MSSGTIKAPAESLRSIAVLIPARDPDLVLLPLVETLSAAGFGAIVLINDGSSPACNALFAEISALPSVHLLQHAVNLGKGRALKTGFNYCLTQLPDVSTVITADADGQHTATDILRVAEASLIADGRVILGSRTFAKDVPLRSKIGNTLTRHIFSFVTGTKLADTQTGLRSFPVTMLPSLMLLDGERYEYEMTVLAHVCRQRKPIEVPIETVYIDGNRSSHFDPIWDSMRIYFVLARFYFSAIVAAGIDFAGFSIAFAATGNVALSVVVGRLSSLVNFALNKKYVFHSQAPVKGTLGRYYVLVAIIGGLSYLLIWAAHRYAHWNVFVAKVVVDSFLSLISFSMQRTFVFRTAKER